jgi:hypothetical protein
MNPVEIEGATHLMKAPEGHPEVGDLLVRVAGGYSVSRWRPTPEELGILMTGGDVELWVMGHQPPVALVVDLPAGVVGRA